jgi:formylglycine-generating enzyme required for sulfatase activity
MPAAKPEPRYDVFISYRRGAADALAVLLQTHLQKQGVTAFLDRDLRRGVFDDMLLRRIAESPSFLIILTPRALDRCSEQEDWLRKEIIQAISSKRNIIPLQVDSFQFTSEVVRALDPAIRDLSRYQAVVSSLDYLESTIERIVKIVEEDKAERKEIERVEAEKQERERAAAEREKQRRSAGEAQRVAEQQRLESERRAVEKAEEQEKEKISTPKTETAGTDTRRAGQWLRTRKALWAGSAIAIMAIIIVIGGLRLWHLPTKPEKEVPSPQPSSSPGETAKINSKDGLKYVWIPPGTFQMGCSAGDSECDQDEKPAHSITIKKGFWLGQTPVTQAAYQRVIGSNPSHFHGEQLPVETVSWNQAKSYCEAVEGRLPTEAEWEYAARASSDASRYGDLNAVAWYLDNSEGKTHNVGLKQANRRELYDMLGNVWEWVGDWYDEKYYAKSPSADPTGPASGKGRVVRGGSWSVGSRYLRSSYRLRFTPVIRYVVIGFRCAREVSP